MVSVDERVLADEEVIFVHLMDGFFVATATRNAVPIKNRKACALLSYLALSPTGSETRERLAGLLWSDRSEEQARASLRQCVKQLREALGPASHAIFNADRQVLSLLKDRVIVDLVDIAQRIESQDLSAALAKAGLRPARILYGFESLDEAFTAWLHVIREHWTVRLTNELQAILRSDSAAAMPRRAAAELILKMDKTHEEAQRFLIARYAEEGNVSSALRQYNELWNLLDEEFDMEPSEETQHLVADIKKGCFERDHKVASPPALLSGGGATSLPAYSPVIGVQRFVRRNSSGELGYFLDGFRRELIASLVRFREWIIVEGDAVDEKAGGRAPLIPSDYQLEGVFFEAAKAVRLVIVLKETATSRYIWSESFELELRTWFATHQEIVRRIALALNVYLSAERVSQRVAEPDISEEAYDAWLRGNELILRWEPSAELQAESIFRKIVAQTPHFAPAYSSLAQIYNTRHIVFPGVRRSAELELQALDFARQAVAIDPLDTRAQLCLAWSNAMRGRFDQAEIYYNLAYELNQSNPATLISCAQGWAFCGFYKRAADLASQVQDLNPMMPAYHWGYLVGIHFLCGDYEASVRAGELAQDRISNLPGWRTAALALLGRLPQAQAAASYFLAFIRQRWRAKAPCTDQAILRWFLHSFPIREQEARERLREALLMAGLPADGPE